ncbi:MAG: Hsp20/alpha crystallin family protein [Pseudazoarcus pumilus]|mgnify:CR=1 FL=1|nr:Hsp20/alpha crystallin family protein [Pseudazoarcus pumilus]
MSDKTTAPAADEPALQPRVDIFEDTGGITLRADLPGVPKDRLAIDVDGDTLRIEGEVVLDAPEGVEATYAEVRLARFRRAFTLSPELDTGSIEAQFRDGVLHLRIPKHAHAQPRRIEVVAG